MNTFVNAIANQEARTENGMKAFKNTSSSLVDLFFKIGASRGKNIVPAFTAALVEDQNLAGRIALWSRDVREGAGERQIFRSILNHLSTNNSDLAVALARKVPEIGRWDDVFALTGPARVEGLKMFADAIRAGNGLACKWAPRKGIESVELRNALGLSPKAYRKTVVAGTKVVETQMCSNQWDEINFSHVPSVASSRYRKAFNRHTPKYAEYVAELSKPVEQRDPKVKVNAGAIYPYDVIKGHRYGARTETELNHIIAQWDALPNFVGDASILPMVDVSGSMTSQVSTGLSAMDVAVSLGLYLSDKNTGVFNGTFLTFSESPELMTLRGNIIQKMDQMIKSKWGMNTNLHTAFDKVLNLAVANSVKAEDMPKYVLILSDMQFDQCVRFDDSAMGMIRRKYANAGYEMPSIIFWNIAHRGENVPVKFNEKGVALVSGFSPTIVKSILSTDLEQFTPYNMMLKTIMNDRYAF